MTQQQTFAPALNVHVGISKTPNTLYQTEPITPGHYCLEGGNEAVQCPPGTYNDNYAATSLAGCTDCPAGSYCEDVSCSGSCEYVYLHIDLITGVGGGVH